jgi:hypothetical protein
MSSLLRMSVIFHRASDCLSAISIRSMYNYLIVTGGFPLKSHVLSPIGKKGVNTIGSLAHNRNPPILQQEVW